MIDNINSMKWKVGYLFVSALIVEMIGVFNITALLFKSEFAPFIILPVKNRNIFVDKIDYPYFGYFELEMKKIIQFRNKTTCLFADNLLYNVVYIFDSHIG